MLFLWRSSQLRRSASSAIAMFPGLRHSSLAYYGAVPLQTKTLPTTTAAAADWQTPTFSPLAHPPLPESSCRVCLWGGGKRRVPCASTLCSWYIDEPDLFSFCIYCYPVHGVAHYCCESNHSVWMADICCGQASKLLNQLTENLMSFTSDQLSIIFTVHMSKPFSVHS